MEDMQNHWVSNKIDGGQLQRIDPTFHKVAVAATCPVAVYRYHFADESWDTMDTVGHLYLYERNASPEYGMVVLNRKNCNNFVHTFGPAAEFVMDEPYILFQALGDHDTNPRDGTHSIYCIWFYEPNDCIAAAKVLREMGLKFEGEGNTFETVGEHSYHIGEDSPSSLGNHAGSHLYKLLTKGKGLPTDKIDICNYLELKGIDSQFEKVHLAATSSVAVYSYNSTEESWTKTDTVGSFFLCERNANPNQYGIIVTNRNIGNNFLQTFGMSAEFVMKKPYILIRAVENSFTDPLSGTDAIYCIWFYEPNDCVSATNVLRDMGLKFEGEGRTFDNERDQFRSHLDEDSTKSSMGFNTGNHLFRILENAKGLPTKKETFMMNSDESQYKILPGK